MATDPKILKLVSSLQKSVKELKEKDLIKVEPKENIPVLDIPVPEVKEKKRFFFFKGKKQDILPPIKPEELLEIPKPKLDIKKEIEKEVFALDDKIIPEKDLKDNKFYMEVPVYDYLWSYKYKRKLFGLIPFMFIGRKVLTKVMHKRAKLVLKKPEKYVKVRFKLLNDRVIEFPVIASLLGFEFKRGKYLFDEGSKYETIQGQQLIPTYDFHESLVIPIKQRLRVVKEMHDYLLTYDKILKKNLTNSTSESLKKDKRILHLLNNYEDMLRTSKEFVIPSDDIRDILESGNITETENIYNPQTLHRYLKADFIQQLVKGQLVKIVKIIFWIIIVVLLILVIVLILNIFTSLQISGAFEQLTATTGG